MPVAEKILTIANNTPKVCKKLFTKKTVSGSAISVGDVCSIEHELKVNLTSDNITDFSGVTVSRYGKNLFDVYRYIPIEREFLTKQIGELIIHKRNTISSIDCYFTAFIPNAKYSISCKFEGEFTGRIYALYGSSVYFSDIKNGIYTNRFETDGNGKIINGGGDKSRLGLFQNEATTTVNCNITSDYLRIYDIQIELGSTVTDYEPYVEPKTITANAGGIVNGLTSLSPNMTLIVDNNDVNIQCSYRSGDNPSNNEKIIRLQNAFERVKNTLKKYS